MIKKIPAIFFILIANIVLLAGVAISHHHHNNQVCIVSAYCQPYSKAHEHGTTKHNHKHNRKNNVDYCILGQVLIIPSNQVKHEYKCLGFPDNRVNYNQFQAILPDLELISFVPIYFYSIQPPLIFLSYCHYSSIALGLRAPPIV
jgi:hypothetical protein